MRAFIKVWFAFCLAIMASGAISGAMAATKPHRHHPRVVFVDAQPPLTVNKRSWLDPGPVAPQGTDQRYVVEGTRFAQEPDQYAYPSRQREDVLPRPFNVPGTMTPLVEFSTPRDPFE